MFLTKGVFYACYVKVHAVRHFVLYMVYLYVVVCVFSRHKLAFSQSRVSSYLFDGSGFALVNNIERRGKIGIVTRFDIEVRTVSNNGILFLMVKEVNVVPLYMFFLNYFALGQK